MSIRHLLACLVALLLGLHVLRAADSPEASAGPIAKEFKALVAKIQAKLDQGPVTEDSLVGELKEFDALIAKYKSRKTEEVAHILLSEAALYVQVLRQPEKASARLRELKDEFSETESGKLAVKFLQDDERRAAAKNLVGRAAPELHFSWASRAGLKTLADVKGKVVVLDFWATWCGPCVASFPEMRELVSRYQDFPVAVIGVTSIQGRVMGLEPAVIDCQDDPEKEKRLMTDYIKAKDLTWTVALSDEPVFNLDYGVEGIPHMVILAPDGTVRHRDLDPRDPLTDKAEKIDALLKEFKLKAPEALGAAAR